MLPVCVFLPPMFQAPNCAAVRPRRDWASFAVIGTYVGRVRQLASAVSMPRGEDVLWSPSGWTKDGWTAKSDANLQGPGQSACLPCPDPDTRAGRTRSRQALNLQDLPLTRMRSQACPCVLDAGVLEAM